MVLTSVAEVELVVGKQMSFHCTPQTRPQPQDRRWCPISGTYRCALPLIDRGGGRVVRGGFEQERFLIPR